MTSPVAQMIIEMIDSGELDQDLDALQGKIRARYLTINPSVMGQSPLKYSGTITAPKFTPGQIVQFRNWPMINGGTAIVMQPSTGHDRWIVKPDAPLPKELERMYMKRYPQCVSVHSNNIK